MNGKSVQLRLFEAVQEWRRFGGASWPCEVKRLDVSAEWWKVGRVRGYMFRAGDLQCLAEI
jgi:hypothetical protein